MVLLAYHLFEEFYIKEMLGIALGCLCMKSNIWLIDYVFWSFTVWAFIKPKGCEAAEAVKCEPWDTKLPCDASGPPVCDVGYDAAWRWALLTEVCCKWLPKCCTGLH